MIIEEVIFKRVKVFLSKRCFIEPPQFLRY